MAACSTPGCVSLATRGDKCAVHSAGYARVTVEREDSRCRRCGQPFRKGEWLRQESFGRQVHATRCAPAVDD